MSLEHLLPGDRVSFVQNGRKLRGVVADTLNMKARGEELEVPVHRPRKTKTCNADHAGKPKPIRIRWLKRSEVRKLPTPTV